MVKRCNHCKNPGTVGVDLASVKNHGTPAGQYCEPCFKMEITTKYYLDWDCCLKLSKGG